MGKKEENASFSCICCQKTVLPLQNGSYRNHCPFCLTSVHVDIKDGDRKNQCNGLMVANNVLYHSKKGWQLVHKCQKCGAEKVNIVADGTVQPDDWEAITQLSSDQKR
jgi:hypothetical protein